MSPTNVLLLDRLPLDIVFDIVMLLDNYREYKTLRQIRCRLLEMDRKAQERLIKVKSYNYDSRWRTNRDKTLNGDIIVTRLDGELHSVNDFPAYINTRNGNVHWFKHGLIHRDNDLPAYIYSLSDNETVKKYYLEGKEYTPYIFNAAEWIFSGISIGVTAIVLYYGFRRDGR